MAGSDRLTPDQRCELGMAAMRGAKIRQLTKRYSCTPATVRRWREEARQQSPNWRDVPRPGAPRALSSAERARARRSALGKQTVPKITKSINKNRTRNVSSATVRRALISGKAPLAWLRQQAARTLSAANKAKRVAFAKAHARAHTGTWLFVDSKPFYLYHAGSGGLHFAWQRRPAAPTQRQDSNPVVLHVYAMVGRGRKSQLIFTAPSPPPHTKAKKGTESFKSKHFMVVATALARAIQGWGDRPERRPLVLDGARPHTAAASQAHMQGLGLRLVEGFPAQSWDINIIENVWGVLTNKLDALPGRLPTTPDGWRRRLTRAWGQVEQATIDALGKSVPSRLAQIVEREGAWLFEHKQKRS